MNQKLISISKAANMLGVHVDTLREWDAKGKLVPVKTVGNHRRYKLEDVETFCGQKSTSSEECVILSVDNVVLLCLSVAVLRNWKNKNVLDLIQSLDEKIANKILKN